MNLLKLIGTVLGALVGLSACQLSHEAKNKPDAEKELELHSSDDEKIPVELWSPEKRKANASYYYLIGEYENSRRNFPKATSYFENAYDLDPSPFLAVKMVEGKVQEDPQQSLDLAKKMALLYPNNSSVLLLYGRLLVGFGEFDKAEKQLRRAIKIDANNTDAYIQLVQIMQEKKNLKETVQFAKEIVRINPNYPDGWAQLAKLFLLSGQYKQAYSSSKYAYDLNGDDPEILFLYAISSEKIGDIKSAVRLYDKILQVDAINDDSIARIVGFQKKLEGLETSLKRLDSSLRSSKQKSFGILMQKSFLLWEMKNFAGSSDLMSEVSDAYPQSDRLRYLAALGEERTEKFDQSLRKYNGIDASSVLYIPSRYRVVEILKKQKKLPDAIKEIREVLDSQVEGSVEFYPIAATLYQDLKQYDDSLVVLEEGFKKYPERVDFLFYEAMTLEKKGEIELAGDRLKSLLKLDSTNSSAYNYLGYMYAEHGIHLKDAEYYIRKAVELKPGDAYYLDSLGWVLYQQEQYQKSLDYLLQADRLAPKEGVILEHISDCYRALGDKENSMKFLEKAVDGKMEETDRKRILDKYEKNKK